MSASELDRLNSLRIPKRRTDWRLGRWTAKNAVALSLRLPSEPESLSAIELRPTEYGAPEVLLYKKRLAIGVSLTHRGGSAACAVAESGAHLGCDLELVESRSDLFVADYFTSQEQALVASAAPEARLWLVPVLWSAKESALKAMRVGLRLDTRSIAVKISNTFLAEMEFNPEPSLTGGPSAWLPLQVASHDGQSFRGWWQRSSSFVRTIVADPFPFVPRVLNPPATRHSGEAA